MAGMKTIGMIGGMSWESTVPYYRIANETVARRLGGLHSAKVLLASVDFAEVERLQRDGDWEAAGRLLADTARSLERAGADFLVVCTNTMHKVAGAIESAVRIPLLHIADATAAEVKARGIGKVGLLGTRFTMEQDFHRRRLEDTFGLEVRVPNAASRELVHGIIYRELCRGIVSEGSRAALGRVVQELLHAGAEAVVLGCTELGLLLRADDALLPLFDTARLHAEAAAGLALEAASDAPGP